MLMMCKYLKTEQLAVMKLSLETFIVCFSDSDAGSDSMVQPQIHRDQLRNISNLDLVELNQISDLIYACVRLLLANFLTLKISHTCTYYSMT